MVKNIQRVLLQIRLQMDLLQIPGVHLQILVARRSFLSFPAQPHLPLILQVDHPLNQLFLLGHPAVRPPSPVVHLLLQFPHLLDKLLLLLLYFAHPQLLLECIRCFHFLPHPLLVLFQRGLHSLELRRYAQFFSSLLLPQQPNFEGDYFPFGILPARYARWDVRSSVAYLLLFWSRVRHIRHHFCYSPARHFLSFELDQIQGISSHFAYLHYSRFSPRLHSVVFRFSFSYSFPMFILRVFHQLFPSPLPFSIRKFSLFVIFSLIGYL